MSLSPELTEYGLTIEDQHLKSTTCRCGRPLKAVPGKDWLLCRFCRKGCSRVVVADPEWAKAQPPAIQSKLQSYYQAVVQQHIFAEAVWERLATGVEADRHLAHLSSMKDHVRVATDEALLRLINQRVVGETIRFDPPAFVIKLEDTVGRITGFAVLSDSSPGAEIGIAKYLHQSAQVAFLHDTKEPLVNVTDLGLLLRLQCRSMATSSALAPMTFANMQIQDWCPLVEGGYIVEADRLDEQLLRALSTSNCLLRLRDLSTRKSIRLSPRTGKQWYSLVCKEAADWPVTAANYIASTSPDVVAVMINSAGLSELTVARVLNKCRPDIASRLRTAIQKQPAICRVSSEITVFDNGVKWTNHLGETVFSGSLRVEAVTEERGKPVYHCVVMTEQGPFSFICGKELERDGLAVAMRKCLLQGLSLTYLQSYSKYALQIAVGLRPVRKRSVPNSALNLA